MPKVFNQINLLPSSLCVDTHKCFIPIDRSHSCFKQQQVSENDYDCSPSSLYMIVYLSPDLNATTKRPLKTFKLINTLIVHMYAEEDELKHTNLCTVTSALNHLFPPLISSPIL